VKGSTPWLCGLGAAVLVAFFGLRASSGFLRVEREIELARTMAARHGLAAADVCALRLVRGGTIAADQVDAASRQFAGFAREFGTALAAVAFCGHETAVRQALVEAGGNQDEALRSLRRQAAGAFAIRFAALRARFLERAPARGRN
jgi:hypothetical protein